MSSERPVPDLYKERFSIIHKVSPTLAPCYIGFETGTDITDPANPKTGPGYLPARAIVNYGDFAARSIPNLENILCCQNVTDLTNTAIEEFGKQVLPIFVPI